MKLNRNGCRIWMWETVGRKCKYYNHLWNSRSNSKINVKKRTIHLTYSTVACGIKNSVMNLIACYGEFYHCTVSEFCSALLTFPWTYLATWPACFHQSAFPVEGHPGAAHPLRVLSENFVVSFPSDTVLPQMGTYPVQKLLCFSYSIFSPL